MIIRHLLIWASRDLEIDGHYLFHVFIVVIMAQLVWIVLITILEFMIVIILTVYRVVGLVTWININMALLVG